MAARIGKELGVDVKHYLEPVYPVGEDVSMTTARNGLTRRLRLAKKFPSSAFDRKAIKEIVDSGKNVLFYDDAIKSGLTFRHVTEPFLQALSGQADRKIAFVVSNAHGNEIEFKTNIVG